MNPCAIIGAPWRFGGRDPNHGLDCWGVVKALRPDVPDYADAPNGEDGDRRALAEYFARETGSKKFRQLNGPQHGCVVLLGNRYITHAGVYWKGRVVHSREDTGVVADLLSDIQTCWKRVEFWAWA